MQQSFNLGNRVIREQRRGGTEAYSLVIRTRLGGHIKATRRGRKVQNITMSTASKRNFCPRGVATRQLWQIIGSDDGNVTIPFSVAQALQPGGRFCEVCSSIKQAQRRKRSIAVGIS